MKKINSKGWLIICIVLVMILITISLLLEMKQEKNKSITTSSNIALSKEKIGWGIKRENNHKQPELGSKNRKLIEKYHGLAMGNADSKNIYLTFDLGYEAGYTAEILNVLKENKVPAAFFITAHYVNTAPEVLKRMIDEGHIVGNHTVNHKSMPSLSKEELTKEVMSLHTAIYEQYHYEMKYLRPPKGEYSEYALETIHRLGYTTVMWSFAYADWDKAKQPSQQEAINKILQNIHNGEIMLLHATSKTNMEVLEEVIHKIQKMGYTFKSLDEFEK